MIEVKFKTSVMPSRTIVTDINATVMSVFDEVGVDPHGSMVTVNGAVVGRDELATITFSECDGVNDGDTVYLNSVVKADGANK